MKQAGTILLLFMIFVSTVFGYLIIRTTYSKKHIENYTALETIHTLEYGDISMERYYRNGTNVKAFGFFRDGSLKSEFYVTDNSGYSSKFISYYPNRQIETRSLKWIEGATKHYLYEEFFEDGRTRRREGTKVPQWEYYDEIGDPTLFYIHSGDRITELMFYPGSKKQDESDYVNGKRDGRWNQWDTLGHQTRKEVYKSGIKVE